MYLLYGSERILMTFRDAVYFQGSSMHAGYVIDDEDRMALSGEWLQTAIAMAMYEGCRHSSADELWDSDTDEIDYAVMWEVVPETTSEADHLAEHCPRNFDNVVVPRSGFASWGFHKGNS